MNNDVYINRLKALVQFHTFMTQKGECIYEMRRKNLAELLMDNETRDCFLEWRSHTIELQDAKIEWTLVFDALFAYVIRGRNPKP